MCKKKWSEQMKEVDRDWEVESVVYTHSMINETKRTEQQQRNV